MPSLMIIKQFASTGSTYAVGPSGVPIVGWVLVRDGFASKEQAQAWLHDQIDSIPEGFGEP